MRKKLAATVCVFAGVIISASLLIVSVLAATSASATITASVSYTPAIQAKVWLNDGGTYTTDEKGSHETKGMLIFNNYDSESLYNNTTSGVKASFTGGEISLDNYSALNGTTFTITVENYSTGINETENKIYLGLKVGGTSNSITGSNPANLEGDKFVTTTFETSVTAFAEGHTYEGYSYWDNQIETDSGTGSIIFTPEIVVPGTLNFDILLFDTPEES